MKQLDAVPGEFKRINSVAVACLRRRLDFSSRHAQAARLEIEPVEFARGLKQRRVATRGHVIDDGAGRGLDIGRHFALDREKARESLSEIGTASVEANRHGGFPGGGLSRKGPLLNGAATNRRQPFAFAD